MSFSHSDLNSKSFSENENNISLDSDDSRSNSSEEKNNVSLEDEDLAFLTSTIHKLFSKTKSYCLGLFEPCNDSSQSGSSNSPKTRPPRTNDDYLKLIMEIQSMTTWEQVKKAFGDTFTPTKLLQIGGDKMDVLGWTNPRNFMVGTNCLANGSNSDRQNSASGYNHATTLNGPGTGLTDIGWTLFSMGPIAFFGGMGWEWGCNFESYRDQSAVSTVNSMSVLGYESKKFVYRTKGGYGRVVMSMQEPKIENMRRSDLVAVRKDGQLKIYWIEDGKLVSRSFSETMVQSIMDSLPETDKESTDCELIRNITSQYKCSQSLEDKILADAEMDNKDLLDRKKVFNHLKQEPKKANKDVGAKEAQKKASQTDEPAIIANLFSLFTGKAALDERKGFFRFLFDFLGSDYDLPESAVENKERSWIEKIIVAMSLAVKRTWDFINNASFIYWLVFFSFASIVGMAAAAASPVFAPIIVGLTLGLSALYILPGLIKWVMNFSKSNYEIRDDQNEKDLMDKERRRMVVECQTRRFIKKEHELDKMYLQDVSTEEIKKEERAYDKVAPTTIKNSKLGKYLLDGNEARFWLAIIIDAITAIVMTSFAFWILSAVTYVFAGAIALFTFFDSMFNSGIAGLLIGAFFAVRKYFDKTAADQNDERCMEEELNKDYKGTGKTKLAVFEALEKELEFGRAKAEWQRLRILLKYAGNNKKFESFRSTMDDFKKDCDEYNSSIPTATFKKNYEKLRDLRIEVENEFHRQNRHLNADSEDTLAREYDLDKIDVYNHEIFEKQRYQPTGWARVKQIGACAYVFLAGGQTGTLLARSLFLAGCVFGGMVASATGSLPIFLGIAITFAVLYGVARVVQFVLEDDRQKKENMVKNIDVRISYLVKKNKMVKTTNSTLEKNKNKDINSLGKIDAEQKQETPEDVSEWVAKRCCEVKQYFSTGTTFFGRKWSFDCNATVVNASDVKYVPLDSDSGNQKLDQSTGSFFIRRQGKMTCVWDKNDSLVRHQSAPSVA